MKKHLSRNANEKSVTAEPIMSDENETTPKAPPPGFVDFVRDRWRALRSASCGADITLEPLGVTQGAMFECATRLKEACGDDFYDEELGYPRFMVPTQDLARVIATASARWSIAIMDSAYFETGKITRMVCIHVVKSRGTFTPALNVPAKIIETDLAKVEEKVMASAKVNADLADEEKRNLKGQHGKKIRDRGEDDDATDFKLHATESGRIKKKVVIAPVKKRTIRER